MIIVTVIIFLIVLGVLVFVHELGHFLMARAFGIRVDEFAIGFGPKIWGRLGASKKGVRVLYSLRAIPFGGFVKIYGEDGEGSEKSGTSGAPVAAASDSLAGKNRGVQALVLFAGILFNFIFAWAILSGIFMIGEPVSPDSYPQYASRIRDIHVIVDDVLPGSPAEKAGLKSDDSVGSIGIVPGGAGAAENVIQNPTVEQIQDTVNGSDGRPVTVNGIVMTPVLGIVPGSPDTYAIGIDMESAGTLQLPPWSAVWEGAKFTIYIVEATAQGVWSLIIGLFHWNQAVLSEVSGPVGIASLVGQAVQVGIINLLMLVAVISVNLGVINLIPFPALDGGRILFVAIEAVTRRRIKADIVNMVNTVGFGLLILLMVVVTWHDIVTRL